MSGSPSCPYDALLPTWPRVGPWTIVRTLGHGGMGAVFAATGPGQAGEVALKIIDAARSAVAKARLLTEARAAAAIGHPHLVRCLDIGETSDLSYLVLELVGGGSAHDRLQAGAVSEQDLLDIARDIGGALGALHTAGVLHRDIKPANILHDPTRRWLLADFGLAHIDDGAAGVTREGFTVGTPDYMSPEQASAVGVDQRSDLYSLGATLYHLATGQPPYGGADVWELLGRVMNDPFPDPRIARPDLSPHLAAVIRKLGAKRPAERYESAAQLADDLDMVAAGRAPVYAGYRGPTELLTAIPAASAAGPRLALIDDDPLARRLFALVLNRLGWQVETAEDLARGLPAAEKADIVVSDLLLPDGSGADLVRRILTRRPALPAVVLTNAFIGSDLAAARSCGAREVLDKATTTPTRLSEVCVALLGRSPTAPAKPTPAAPDAVLGAADATLARIQLLVERLARDRGENGLLDAIAGAARAIALAAGDLARPAAAELASAIEGMARQLIDNPDRFGPAQVATLQRAIAAARPLLVRDQPARGVRRALVVDDEPASRILAGRALAKVAIEHTVVGTPAEALAHLREHPCDLLLTDVVMDGASGFQLAASARQIRGHERLPVIFVTGLTDFVQFFQADPTAGCDLIRKPYLLIELGTKALVALAGAEPAR